MLQLKPALPMSVLPTAFGTTDTSENPLVPPSSSLQKVVVTYSVMLLIDIFP